MSDYLPRVLRAEPVYVLRSLNFYDICEAGERLVVRDRTSKQGAVISTQGPFHNLEAVSLGGRRHRIAWTSTTGEGNPQVVDVDLSTAALEDVTLPWLPPVVVPTLIPAGRPLWTGSWDISSEPSGVPHAIGCTVFMYPDNADPPCSCGAKAYGPGYDYHRAPGNMEVICRYAEMHKRKQPALPFICTPMVAKHLTDVQVKQCIGILCHLWANEAHVPYLDECRQEADHLGVPVWLYVDRLPWLATQQALLRSRGPGLCGDVAMLMVYVGQRESLGAFQARIIATLDDMETWEVPLALTSRLFTGPADEVPLLTVLVTHEWLSSIVAARSHIVAHTTFCWAPAARGGALRHAALREIAQQIADGVTGEPVRPLVPELPKPVETPTIPPIVISRPKGFDWRILTKLVRWLKSRF